mmetsp:Transcript_40351/g.70557  ORF Transcript_40351/g.70557 Transcript_40351/m.70557 type:complete len:166 (+) Transcript_40351:60-557(+)
MASSLAKSFFVFLAIMLVFIFGCAGVMKLTDMAHPETYELMDTLFKEQYTPLWQAKVGDKLGITIDASSFKLLVGLSEVILAASLLTPLRNIGAMLLALFMVGAMMTHVWLHEPAGFQALLIAGCLSFSMFEPEEGKLENAPAPTSSAAVGKQQGGIKNRKKKNK